MSALQLDSPETRTVTDYMEVSGRLAASLLNALGDEVSRKIVTSMARGPMTISEVSRLEKIPQSTCYRRVNELLAEGLLVVDRIFVTPEGRYASYAGCFSAFKVSFNSGELSVTVRLNDRVAGKVRTRWISTAWSPQAGIQQ